MLRSTVLCAPPPVFVDVTPMEFVAEKLLTPETVPEESDRAAQHAPVPPSPGPHPRTVYRNHEPRIAVRINYYCLGWIGRRDPRR